MSQPNQTLATLTEADVQRLCGTTVFRQADALQRAGHVQSASLDDDLLSGNVRGTWRRVDMASVQFRAGRVQPECTRDGVAFCRHVGALLLQWLRQPSTVARSVPGLHFGFDPLLLDADFDEYADPEKPPDDPLEELTRQLEHQTVARLREIAKLRSLRVTGTKKADIIAQLAPAMMDPDNIDATIVGLSKDERAALDAAWLLSGDEDSPSSSFSSLYLKLGGEGNTSLTRLQDLGLVMIPNQTYYGPNMQTVPQVVSSRLLDIQDLVQPTRDQRQLPQTLAGIDTAELVLLVALEARGGTLHSRQETTDSWLQTSLPPGMRLVADNPPEDFGQLLIRMQQGERFPLLPTLPTLADADLRRLGASAGQPVESIELALTLMTQIGIFEPQIDPTLTIREEHLRSLLASSPALRREALAFAWRAYGGWFAQRLMFAEHEPLRLYWHTTNFAWNQTLTSAITSAVDLIAMLIGRLPAGTWYDVESFVGVVANLAPDVAPLYARVRGVKPFGGSLSLIWVDEKGTEQELNLRTNADWSRFVSSIVRAVLAGPLAWMGLVEISAGPDGPRAFRPGDQARVLAGRSAPTEMLTEPLPLAIDDELCLLVPVGTSDPPLRGLLARAAVMVDATTAGVRFRLTPTGVQDLFDTGMSGPDLARFLEERSGKPLPAPARESLDHWWQGYGSVRLYDDLTIIELGDDLLLRELLATTLLGPALVHTFSPRLIAVDSSHQEQVVRDLTARGYTPRVVESE